VKELKILKVVCADCGYLSLIPMSVAAAKGEPIRCEKCGRILVKRD
jgi:ribosomal protein S27E